MSISVRKRFRAYGFDNPLQDLAPLPIISQRDPATSDKGFPLGTPWINEAANHSYILTSVAGGQANWEPVSQSAGGNAPITQYVVAQDGSADYTTIQTAIDAIVSGGINATIYVRPGTYTENLDFSGTTVLPIGLTLVGATALGDEGQCEIIGTHVPPNSGTLVLRNFKLSDTDAIFNSIDAGNAHLVVIDSEFNVTNGWSFDLPNWTGIFEFFDTNPGSQDDGFINNSGGATLFTFSAGIGAGTANLMLLSGPVIIGEADISCPVNFSTGTQLNCAVVQFSQPITFSGNSTGKISYGEFSGGSSPSITMSSTGNIDLPQAIIESSNDPAIAGTGSGILKITSGAFTQNSNISSSLTVQSGVIKGGNFITQYVVDPTGESGAYKTIQAALDAANSEYLSTSVPQTVYIRPGSYTENLTLYVGIDLCAAGGQVDSKFTNIIGTHALPSGAGTIAMYGIWFTGTTACFTGSSGTAKINMFNVITEITGSGYTFDINGFSGEINIFDYLQSDTGTNGFIYNPTGSCGVTVIFAAIGISQNLGAIAQISGNGFFQGMLIGISMNFISNSYAEFNISGDLLGTISTADNASINIANCYMPSLTAPAIIHNSTGTVFISSTVINSSNNPAITGTGSGILTLTGVDFLQNSNIAGTLTLATGDTRSGEFIATTPGKGLSIAEGTNARMGGAFLTAGTAIIPTTAVTANSRIYLTTQVPTGTVGHLHVSSRIVGTQFTITSSSGADASFVAWMIVEPA